jgi:hypothetical protein
MTHVIGVDLSYTATGIAWPDGQDIFCTTDQDGDPYERASTIAAHRSACRGSERCGNPPHGAAVGCTGYSKPSAGNPGSYYQR